MAEENRRLAGEVQSAAKLSDLMGSVASLLSNMPAMSFSKDAETALYRMKEVRHCGCAVF